MASACSRGGMHCAHSPRERGITSSMRRSRVPPQRSAAAGDDAVPPAQRAGGPDEYGPYPNRRPAVLTGRHFCVVPARCIPPAAPPGRGFPCTRAIATPSPPCHHGLPIPRHVLPLPGRRARRGARHRALPQSTRSLVSPYAGRQSATPVVPQGVLHQNRTGRPTVRTRPGQSSTLPARPPRAHNPSTLEEDGSTPPHLALNHDTPPLSTPPPQRTSRYASRSKTS
ncbi:hypothetical protein HRbin28_00161 [bacterium HR28]|nr:hypothetical protein HRbin28_00161 [bacterium HR28]